MTFRHDLVSHLYWFDETVKPTLDREGYTAEQCAEVRRWCEEAWETGGAEALRRTSHALQEIQDGHDQERTVVRKVAYHQGQYEAFWRVWWRLATAILTFSAVTAVIGSFLGWW